MDRFGMHTLVLSDKGSTVISRMQGRSTWWVVAILWLAELVGTRLCPISGSGLQLQAWAMQVAMPWDLRLSRDPMANPLWSMGEHFSKSPAILTTPGCSFLQQCFPPAPAPQAPPLLSTVPRRTGSNDAAYFCLHSLPASAGRAAPQWLLRFFCNLPLLIKSASF